MLSVASKPLMLSVILLNVIMQSVVMLSVVMLNVVAPFCCYAVILLSVST
jgi:hypothetical protein